MQSKAFFGWRIIALSLGLAMTGGLLAQAVKSYFAEVYNLEASGFKYQVENKYGYLGAYQMGVEAMIEAGFIDRSASAATRRYNDWSKVRWLENPHGVASKQTFLLNKAAQDYAVRKYTDAQWQQAKNLGLDKFVGQTVQGIKITKEGILGMMHLKGGGGARAFLVDGADPTDKNGTPVSSYARKLGPTKLDAVAASASTADDALKCNTVFTYIGLWGPREIVAELTKKGMSANVGGQNRALWAKIGTNDAEISAASGDLKSRLIERKRDAHIEEMKPVYDANPRKIVSDYDYCISHGISSEYREQR